VAQASTRVSSPSWSSGAALWLEARPAEAGRAVLVAREVDGAVRDLTPPGFSVRTRVHEYGGGAYVAWGRSVAFSNWQDQRLYLQDPWGSDPRPLTPPDQAGASTRYADACPSPDGAYLVAVREHHPPGAGPAEVVNDLAVVPTDGGFGVRRLAGGDDFYAFPRLSPDGRRLAWVSWCHPDMPWDSTRLWVAELRPGGELGEPRLVAGGPQESVLQPTWGPAGQLWYVSDRRGWWNPYLAGRVEPLVALEAEFAGPLWSLGQSNLAPLEGGRLACAWSEPGRSHLGVVGPDGSLQELACPFSSVEALVPAGPRRVLVLGSSPDSGRALAAVDADTGETELLRPPPGPGVDRRFFSRPQPLEVASGSRRVHALLYRPANPGFRPLPGERPPLLVNCHGGPTGSAQTGLDLGVQYWTTRGFALVDVDYAGSSGYGRRYRKELEGRWGLADAEDCVRVAEHLVEAGEADPARLAVRGASAGGFTALSVLATSSMFAAGATYYGVTDLERLASDTHKFESRYLERLVGPYPERADLYRKRSPVSRVGRIGSPVLVLQGSDDPVVPPQQAEAMVGALRARGVPVAYLVFEGEQHGFRQDRTIALALQAELSFYASVMSFTPADRLPELELR
jgi:dipeptidyl aminopeptidase/acylaminoacyl peptidase